jgi:hypothetical protein
MSELYKLPGGLNVGDRYTGQMSLPFLRALGTGRCHYLYLQEVSGPSQV